MCVFSCIPTNQECVGQVNDLFLLPKSNIWQTMNNYKTIWKVNFKSLCMLIYNVLVCKFHATNIPFLRNCIRSNVCMGITSLEKERNMENISQVKKTRNALWASKDKWRFENGFTRRASKWFPLLFRLLMKTRHI